MKHFLLLALLLALSCDDESSHTRQQLERMLNSHIEVPFNDLITWENNDATPCADTAEYTLVVYMDSFACTSCMIRSMHLWNHFMDQIQQAERRVNTVFIMSVPESQELGELKLSFLESGLKHNILIDTASHFLQINPQIPAYPLFHTFLMNKNDSVVLVGDPLRNRKIKEMMFEIVGIEDFQ